jgi:hypothetical protein
MAPRIRNLDTVYYVSVASFTQLVWTLLRAESYVILGNRNKCLCPEVCHTKVRLYAYREMAAQTDTLLLYFPHPIF